MVPVELDILKDNTHSYVGLDLSLHSSGMSYVTGDTVYAETFDATTNLDSDDPLYDGKIRERVREVLIQFITDRNPEFVVIEDVFNGHTPKVYRQLMNINNIVDELILQGIVRSTLIRVDNRRWKSWLSSLVPNDQIRMMKDKVKIEICLNYYGLTRAMVDHRGYQDEFDSIGMALGYYLHTFYNNQEVTLHPVIGEDFNRKQLMGMIEVSQSRPVSYPHLDEITNNHDINRAVSRGILCFLRYAYDILAQSEAKCIKFTGVNMGNLCSDFSLVPTFPPSDLYISYKK